MNKVKVEVRVNLTEDEYKVRRAIKNIFGDVDLNQEMVARGQVFKAKLDGMASLAGFRDLLRRERIRDAARAILFKSLQDKTITFYLNKQVAYAGHISFCQRVGESPLGPIRVEMEFDEPIELINWLAPKTRR